jgi:thioredoxin reductase (NADPH)
VRSSVPLFTLEVDKNFTTGINHSLLLEAAIPLQKRRHVCTVPSSFQLLSTFLFCVFLDLTKYASQVYVLVRRDELRASKIMAKRLMNHPKVVSLQFIILANFRLT